MFKSHNFYVSLITAALGVLQGWGITIGDSAEGIFEIFASGNIPIMIMFAVNLFNPIKKIIENKLWTNLEFLYSRNFLTQATTVVLALLAWIFGAEIPADGAEPIVDAVQSGNWGMIMSAVGLHVVNFLQHLFEKPEGYVALLKAKTKKK